MQRTHTHTLSNSYHVLRFSLCAFHAMQKFHVRNCKNDRFPPFFISLLLYLFSLTHSIQVCIPHSKIAQIFETLVAAIAAVAAKITTTTTRLVKWIHILFLLSFIVLCYIFGMPFLSRSLALSLYCLSFAMKCAQKYLHINNNMIKMSLIELASRAREREWKKKTKE